MKTIISLTSIPSRFDYLNETLQSLADQNLDEKEVHLYIPKTYARFPDFDGKIPAVPKGVSVFRPDHDYGPASKALHAVEANMDVPDQVIIYCDDDKAFDADWAGQLLSEAAKRPDCAICFSGLMFARSYGRDVAPTPNLGSRAKRKRKALDFGYMSRKTLWQIAPNRFEKPRRKLFSKSGYVDAGEGFGGVLIKPKFFDARVFDIPKEGRYVDDVWLSANIAKNGYGIWLVGDVEVPAKTSAANMDSLLNSSFDGNKRRDLDIACMEYCQRELGIWQETARSDPS